MQKQGKLKTLFTFLTLTAFFAAGYLYSNSRNSSKSSTSSLKTTSKSAPEQKGAQSLSSRVDPFISAASNYPKTRAEKYNRLKKLSPEVQISYFGDLLGRPTYINYFDNNTRGYEFLKDEIREYIFVDEDYYVQAITDKHDKIMSFAVTSRKEDFSPVLPWGNAFKVILNKTPFSEWIAESPLTCYRFTGAHEPSYYFEEAYFGNPGHYLTYLVGTNTAGYSSEFIPSGDDGNYFGRTDCNLISKDDRKNFIPNTFIIRGMSFVAIDIPERMEIGHWTFFGPDQIQVRTLNE